MGAALEFDNCSLAYGNKTVLTGVDGSVQAGEALALIGPNGSGKTTLLRGIIGSVRVSAGHLRVPPGSTVGYVPQQLNLDPTFPITARQVVAMGYRGQRKLFGRLGSTGKQRIEDALANVGMSDRGDVRFGDLSGGQRQRILLARALVAEPAMILLDEPFNGLDEPNRRALLSIITNAKNQGVAVVISTHDLILADATCERALLLAGRQVAFGPIAQVLTPELVATAYGGSVPVELAATSAGKQEHRADRRARIAHIATQESEHVG